MRLLTFAITTAIGLGMVSNVSQVVAGTATANLAISANVASKCSLTGGSLPFGAYDPVGTNASAPLDAQGSFQVQCTKGSTGTLLLGAGTYSANASGTGAGTTRAMKANSSATYMGYELYTSNARTTVWNDTTQTVSYGPAANASPSTQTVFGRIPGGQVNVTADNYVDTVLITVNY